MLNSPTLNIKLMVSGASTISLMVKVGEFSKAESLTKELRESNYKVDENIEFMLKEAGKEIETQSGKFEHYNQKGQDCFNAGKFQAAFEAFGNALKYSQVNVEVALNLLHSSVRIMEQTTKPDLITIVESKKVVKLLQELTLTDEQSSEFQQLKLELSQYMDLK